MPGSLALILCCFKAWSGKGSKCCPGSPVGCLQGCRQTEGSRTGGPALQSWLCVGTAVVSDTV